MADPTGFGTILNPNFSAQRESALIEGLYYDTESVDISNFTNNLDGVPQVDQLTITAPTAAGQIYSFFIQVDNAVGASATVSVVSVGGETANEMAIRVLDAFYLQFAIQAVVDALITAAGVITFTASEAFSIANLTTNIARASISSIATPEAIGYGLVVWQLFPVSAATSRAISVVNLSTEAQGQIAGITTRSDIYGVRNQITPIDGFFHERPVPVATNGRVCVRAVTNLAPGLPLFVYFRGPFRGRLGGSASADAFEITDNSILPTQFIAANELGFVKANR